MEPDNTNQNEKTNKKPIYLQIIYGLIDLFLFLSTILFLILSWGGYIQTHCNESFCGDSFLPLFAPYIGAIAIILSLIIMKSSPTLAKIFLLINIVALVLLIFLVPQAF